jgi:hypothetical protein
MEENKLSDAGRNRVPAWAIALLLFLAFSSVYILFRTAQYNGDMVWQSRTAAGISPIRYKADHLFYGPMVRGIWLAWQGLGLPGEAHVALQTVNALFGGLSAAMLFLIAHRITKRRAVAVVAAVVFGLTPYVWSHATDVETYGSTKALFLITVYFVFLMSEGGSLKRRCWLALAVALFHALATFIQYKHVFLVPAVVLAAFMPRQESLRSRLSVAAVYLLAVGVIVWGAFLYVGFAVEGIGDFAGFKKWLLSPGYGWPAFARMGWMTTPLKFAVGFSGWPTTFRPPMHLGKRVLLGQVPLMDYLADYGWRIALIATFAIVQLALIAYLVKNWRRISSEWGRSIVLGVSVYVFYQLFSIYWGGFFASFSLPLYFLILVLAFEDIRRHRKQSKAQSILVSATLILVFANAAAGLAFRYIPQHDPANNRALQECLEVAARLDTRDVIFGPGGCLTSEYWGYFAHEKERLWLESLVPRRGAEDPLGQMLNTADQRLARYLAEGRRVYVSRLFADEDEITRPWNEFLFAGVRRKDVVAHFRRYPHREAFTSHGNTYWELLGVPDTPQ